MSDYTDFYVQFFTKLHQATKQEEVPMWQYCKWCETYYNKFGPVCPHCFIPFAQDSSSLPDSAMQARLTKLWNEQYTFAGQELYIPEIAKCDVEK
jgi:hypothetical protein